LRSKGPATNRAFSTVYTCSAIDDIETTEHASADSLLVFMEIWTQFMTQFLMKFSQPDMEMKMLFCNFVSFFFS
jgi:hypothetical protein